ncbi:Lipase [Macleaya cordata]|uniref:Lipase n=1 Tax=Macleaya cordata TaxID=56857 RepID=A0A200QKZ5_MACCD|nr:Lipase [Macleaya cordata]
MPLVKTLTGETSGCADSYNNASFSFNTKARNALATINKSGLGIKTVFVDAYATIQNAMNNPTKYGFTETSKGCCGSGTIEFGDTCKGMSTCKDPSKYVFWDAVHPTEKMYRIIADEALRSVSSKILV